VWLYLLGHYEYGSTSVDRADFDDTVHHQYEQTMSEWLAAEAIVRQRDQETATPGNGGGTNGTIGGCENGVKTKFSSESQDGQIPLVRYRTIILVLTFNVQRTQSIKDHTLITATR